MWFKRSGVPDPRQRGFVCHTRGSLSRFSTEGPPPHIPGSGWPGRQDLYEDQRHQPIVEGGRQVLRQITQDETAGVC